MLDSRYGIHDISRIELTQNLPRFNMPFELGIDMGFRRIGGSAYKNKRYLILDRTKYRYMRTVSDLNGRDPSPHYGRERDIIIAVRNWLASEANIKGKPSGHFMYGEFKIFKKQIPKICAKLELHQDGLLFSELSFVVADFLRTLKTKSKTP
jgi:hypothetical protein